MKKSFEEAFRSIIKNQTLYKSVRLINNTLIIVLNDGEVLTKLDASEEDYHAIINAPTPMSIKEQMGETEEKDVVKKNPTLTEIKKTIKKRTVHL